jgi:hypothetical protein
LIVGVLDNLAKDLILSELHIEVESLNKLVAEKDKEIENLRKLVWGAVHNAGRLITSGRTQRWSAVAEALGVGSTAAHQLCRDHQLDPDELVGRGDECGGCEVEDFFTERLCGGCMCPEKVRQFCTRSDDKICDHEPAEDEDDEQ